jgi:branched-chain amino acid transport system substrate-binding protein
MGSGRHEVPHPMASTTFGGGNESLLLSPEEGNGIVSAFSYFQEVENSANAAFLQKFRAKFGSSTPYLGGELAMRTYVGLHLWAEGVRRAKTIDRMKAIEALGTGVSFDGPPGRTVLDPKTNHVTLDVYVAEVQNRGFKVLQHFPASRPPTPSRSATW